MARAIYYDTETTGVKSDRDRVIEIAAFDPDRDATFEFLINPGVPIPPEATAIHKITNEMVASAESFAEVGARFARFCEGDVILIAHNNDAFDLLFLKAEFARAGLEFPTNWRFLDSLKWARKFRPDLPRHPLQTLRETYGIPANNAHRALDDVIVLHKVCSCLFDDLTIDEAVQALAGNAANQEVRHMPFGKHQGVPLAKLPSSYARWLLDNGALDKPENLGLRLGLEKAGLITTTAASAA